MSHKLVVWQGPEDEHCFYSSIGSGFMKKQGVGLSEDDALALWINLRLLDNTRSFIADPADLPQDRFCRNSWVVNQDGTALIRDMGLAVAECKKVIIRAMNTMLACLRRDIDLEELKAVRAAAKGNNADFAVAKVKIAQYTSKRDGALDKSLDLDSELAGVTDEAGLRAYWPSEIDREVVPVDNLQKPVFKLKV